MKKYYKAFLSFLDSNYFLEPLKIVSLYLFIGVFWIIFSDSLMLFFIRDLDLISKVSILKGWFYILITSILLFFMIRRDIFTIKKITYYDTLTDLPNRSLFVLKLDNLISTNINKAPIAVLVLDIDNFRDIYDTFGNDICNNLLKSISSELNNLFDSQYIVSHFTGDVFAIAAINMSDDSKVKDIIKKIQEVISRPWTVNNHEFFISGSIGISVFPHHGKDSETLLKNAGLAMYKSKQEGKSESFFFSEHLNNEILERLELDNALRKAVERKEFVVYYQPQVEISSGKIIGLEALVRWNHPQKGLISPGAFIPLAEETGLIISIGEFVLYSACQQVKKWQDEGLEIGRLAVNLSIHQFQQDNINEKILDILRKTSFSPSSLDIEITESIAIKNFNNSVKILNSLKSLGIKISLDDFGTGYSSLNYIKTLPIDNLKIDKSFINDIDNDKEKQAIFDAITYIAQKLSLEVTAEGVETTSQLDYIKSSNCNVVQGYIYSKPLPAAEVYLLLKSGKITL